MNNLKETFDEVCKGGKPPVDKTKNPEKWKVIKVEYRSDEYCVKGTIALLQNCHGRLETISIPDFRLSLSEMQQIIDGGYMSYPSQDMPLYPVKTDDEGYGRSLY